MLLLLAHHIIRLWVEEAAEVGDSCPVKGASPHESADLFGRFFRSDAYILGQVATARK